MPDVPDPGQPQAPFPYGFDLPPDASLGRRIWNHVIVGLMYTGFGMTTTPVPYEAPGPPSEEGDPRP
jgi:hypothetical protein